MRVYQYDGSTGEYVGHKEARVLPGREDWPADDTARYQIPANSTLIETPSSEPGFAVVWGGEQWSLVPDHRGSVWYDDSTPVEIDFIGDPSNHGLLESPIIPIPTSDDVNAERDRRISSGFVFAGTHFDADPESRENISGAAQLATMAVMNGAQVGDLRWHGGDTDFVWIAADNSLVPMDAPTVMAFAQAAAEHKRHLIFAARTIKDTPGGIPADYTDDSYWE